MTPRSGSSPLRSSIAKLAIAGAAGLASVLTFAPMAVAAESAPSDTGSSEAPDTTTTTTSSDAPTDDPSPTPTDPAPTDPAPTDPAPTDPAPSDPAPPPTDGPTDPGDQTPGTGDATPGTRTPAPAGVSSQKSAVKAQADVEPDFGYNKFRVGVKLADGSYAPSGTSTLGSTITIVETGPGVSGGTLTTPCTTTTAPADPNGVSFCENIGPSGGPFDGSIYLAEVGDTVTVTQTAATPNLEIVDGTKVVVPEPCNNDGGIPSCLFNEGDVLLTDAPLPPTATDDKATTDEGVPVTIKVLHNDNRRGAPINSVHVTNDPNHGTTKVTGSGNSRHIRYTPEDGFTGTDHFTYDFTTPNGTATAHVTIEVRASEPTTTATTPEGVLPDTGGSDPRLLGLGLMLVAGGGALTAVGRRPRRTDAIG